MEGTVQDRPRRFTVGGVSTLAGVLLLVILGWVLAGRLWERFGPVPVRHVASTALVRQWSATTCGPAALATVLNVYGQSWSPAGLEKECGVTAAGCSLLQLQEVCRNRGLRAEGLRATSPNGLLRVPQPYIAHLTEGHFVLVTGVRGGQLNVFDPTTGEVSLWTPRQIFQKGRGAVLAITSG